jgi:hypothetical protein
MLIWLLLHFTIGLAGTWMARQYALRRELIDHPGERRSHHVPTPRGGGLSIVIALLVATCVAAWRSPEQIVLIAGFGMGLLLVAGIGMVDDHRPLSPWLRLAVQAFAASVFALAVAGAWGDLSAAMFAFLAVMVLTNILELHGWHQRHRASQAVVVATGLALLLGGIWGWMALALVAACLASCRSIFPRPGSSWGTLEAGHSDSPWRVCWLWHGSAAPSHALIAVAAYPVPGRQHAYSAATPGQARTLVDCPCPACLSAVGFPPRQSHACDIGVRRLVGRGWVLSWWLATKTEQTMMTGCAIWLTAAALLWAVLQYSPVNESSIEKDRK